MANEFSFMFIDIENAIDLYKLGLIGETAFINKVQTALNEYGGEPATIVFDEPTSVFGRNGGSTGDVVE